MSEDKIINRIKKMLALANDLAATEGERDNALRMAFSTMAKYNIDQATVDKHSTVEQRIDFANQSFSWIWAKRVQQMVADLFFCKFYWREKVNNTQVKYHFIGKESNAMTAAVMADWIVKSILKEARVLYKQNTSPETRAFATGAADRLAQRIHEIKQAEMKQQEASGTGTALVLASLYDTEQKANEEFWAATGAEIKSVKLRDSDVDPRAYLKGREFADKINLNRQLDADVVKQKALK